jgi:hypothetical protein
MWASMDHGPIKRRHCERAIALFSVPGNSIGLQARHRIRRGVESAHHAHDSPEVGIGVVNLT